MIIFSYKGVWLNKEVNNKLGDNRLMKQTVMENKSLLDIENDYMPINKFYIINKGNNDSDSISIRVPGHANSGYDRIQIWA